MPETTKVEMYLDTDHGRWTLLVRCSFLEGDTMTQSFIGQSVTELFAEAGQRIEAQLQRRLIGG